MRHGLKPRTFWLLAMAVAMVHGLLIVMPGGQTPSQTDPISPLELVLVQAASLHTTVPPARKIKSNPQTVPLAVEPAQTKAQVATSAAPVIAPALPSEKHSEPGPAQAATIQSPAPQSIGAPTSLLPLQQADFRAASLGNRPADYPRLARQRGWEGKVILEVDVSAQGKPLSVRIFHSSGYPQLDEAATETVTAWRFTPARRGNEALADTVHVPIEFRLQ
jgi:protein TonB